MVSPKEPPSFAPDTPAAQQTATSTMSPEQMALTDFCQRLGSSTMNEPGLVNEDETRLEAKLLMSLSMHNSSNQNPTDPLSLSETVASSSSSDNNSYASLDSQQHPKKSNLFSFTCPSLSLENPSTLHIHSKRTTASQALTKELAATSTPRPALLLGRPLTVDDRDALRLSADAMARNVLQTFQKAMDWRVQAWTSTLSNQLVAHERAMVQSGASEQDIKEQLAKTPHAAVLVALRSIAGKESIAVHSTYTSFYVLHRILEENQQVEPTTSRQQTESPSAASSVSSASSLAPASTEESCGDDYHYSVEHELQFTCDIHLKTMDQFSEVSIQVPGVVQGTFRGNVEQPELLSVTLNINTDVLANMVEKACRTIARTSLEKIVKQLKHQAAPPEQTSTEAAVPATPTRPTTTEDETFTLQPNYTTALEPSTAAAFVTPRQITQNSNDSDEDSKLAAAAAATNRCLLPIPDDFKKCEPRRLISPQPTFMGRASTPPALMPRRTSNSSRSSCTKRTSPEPSTRRRRPPPEASSGACHSFLRRSATTSTTKSPRMVRLSPCWWKLRAAHGVLTSYVTTLFVPSFAYFFAKPTFPFCTKKQLVL